MNNPNDSQASTPSGQPFSKLCGTTVCYPTFASDQFPLPRALQGIAAAGLKYVELVSIPAYCYHLEPATMGDAEVAAMLSLLASFGLEAIAINAASNLTTDDGVSAFEHPMRVARDLGVGVLVTSVQQTETDDGLQGFVARAARLQTLAEQYNLVIALETHRGHVNSGVNGAALLRRLGADRIKITYDTANVLNRGSVLPEVDLAQMGADIGRYIAHVHLKDKTSMTIGERKFPAFGTGVLDLPASLALLSQGGYSGPLSLEVELDGEPESPEQVDEAIAASLRYLETLWGAAQAS